MSGFHSANGLPTAPPTPGMQQTPASGKKRKSVMKSPAKGSRRKSIPSRTVSLKAALQQAQAGDADTEPYTRKREIRRQQPRTTNRPAKKAKVTQADTVEYKVEDQQEQGQEDVAHQGEMQQDLRPQAVDVQADIKYPIRRILAQKPSSTGKKEFLVEYQPTWESEASIRKQAKALKIWESNKKKGFTFDYQDSYLTKKIILKATNPTSDDDPKLARQMFDTVTYQVQKFLKRPGLLGMLFKKEEWAFATETDDTKAAMIADWNGHATPDAAQVMQSTVESVRYGLRKGWSTKEMLGMLEYLHYSKIRVCYLGQIDDTIHKPASCDERNQGTVISFLRPMYELARQDLNSAPWDELQLRSRLASLAETVVEVLRKSTFLLKKEYVWPLFFVRFFIFSDDMKLKLNPGVSNFSNPDIKTQKYEISEDWHEETRDWFLQAYSEKMFGRWDPRALEYIERTYIQCRDGVMERVKDAEKLEDGGEVPESVEDEEETDAGDEQDSVIAASDSEYDEGNGLFEVEQPEEFSEWEIEGKLKEESELESE